MICSAHLIVVIHERNEEWGIGDRGVRGFIQIQPLLIQLLIELLLQHLQVSILQRSGVRGQSAPSVILKLIKLCMYTLQDINEGGGFYQPAACLFVCPHLSRVQ